MTLLSYLRSIHRALPTLASTTRNVHVVIGNEACDLDSAVCAIVTGYLLASKSERLVVPMMNIPRSDYPLKTEVQYVFNKSNITEDLLFFLDDLSLSDLHQAKRLKLTLVDHNVVAKCLEPVNDAVVHVVDHHKWEGSFSSPVEKTVEMVGSCATLVGEKLLAEHRELADQTITKLLISTIVTDTVNFSESAKKTTPKDLKVFKELLALLPDAEWSNEFEEIKQAKENVSRMAVCNLLRKDLKVVSTNELTVAISSVPVSLRSLIAMSTFQIDLDLFRQQQQANAVVVMTITSKAEIGGCNKVERGMVIYVETESLRNALLDYLKKFKQPSLELQELYPCPFVNQHPTMHFYIQNNVAASRKVVLPAIRTFMQSYDSSQ
ncbi:protein prune-like [Tropilaelaps mercedesae]|uniref:Protein prune-like n=1 Tax=Tropilaelaps mercedesae TaxID=418985 RepID=A0A1V9XEV2_9ACAR|nr:protein prune-like [Tropilaelaps mercedesae]